MASVLSITMYFTGDSFVKNEFAKKTRDLTDSNTRIAEMIIEKKSAVLLNAIQDMEFLFSSKTELLTSGQVQKFENEMLRLYDESFAKYIDIFFFRSVDGSYLFDASTPLYDTSRLKEYMTANSRFLRREVRLVQSESTDGTLIALAGASEAVNKDTGELAGYFYIGLMLNNSGSIIREIEETAGLHEAAIIFGDTIIAGDVTKNKNEIIKSCYNQKEMITHNNEVYYCSDISLGDEGITLKFYQSMPESFISSISRQYRKMAYIATAMVVVITLSLGYLLNLIAVRALYRVIDHTKHVLAGRQSSFSSSLIYEFNLLAEQIGGVSEDLNEAQAYLKNLIENAEAPIAVWNKFGDITLFNSALEKLSGRSAESVIGKHISSIYGLFPQATVSLQSKEPSKSARFETVVTNVLTEASRYVFWNLTDVFKEGEYSGTILQGIDITERKEAEEQMELASKVFENAHDGMAIISPKGIIISCNESFTKLSGYEDSELRGKDISFLRCGKHSDQFYRKIWLSLYRHGKWTGEVWHKNKAGEQIPTILTISGIKDNTGRIINYATAFHDISERKKYEEHIEYQANHDGLTGLPNRNYFVKKLLETLEQHDGYSQVAMVFMDIDRFKNLNDTLGHSTGDRVLEIISERIRNSVRETTFVSRFSGDEFGIMFTDLRNKNEAAERAKKLISTISEPVTIQGYELFIQMSAGLSHFPENGKTPSELIKNAEIAMYQAKQKGRNNLQTYTAGVDSIMRDRLLMESKLNRAIENNELTVFYQPKIDLTNMNVMGMEALLRWNNPDLGSVPPSAFIPLAEETGLILPIGEWVLNQSLKDTAQLHKEGFSKLKIAINLSLRQFMKKDLVNYVRQSIKNSGIGDVSFEFEITENIFSEDISSISKIMNELSRLNIKFAIDDFGTGYSSIGYLKKMPISTLKIDKSYIDAMSEDSDSESIVSSVILMAKSLGISVVAEGAEDESQVELLKQMGCSIVQGYYFGKPMPLDQFRQFLKDWDNRS